MNHKNFLRTLPLEKQMSLQEKSDIKGLVHLVGHWGAILMVGWLIVLRIPFWQALLPVQGILLIMNFTLLHECTHATPFRSIWINRWVGRICGVGLVLPFEWFRYFHFAHHKYTNDPANDPELTAGAKPENWREYLVAVSGMGVWISQTRTVLVNAFGRSMEKFVPARAHRRIRIESRIMIAVYLALMFFTIFISNSLIFLWVVPLLLGQPFLRLYLLAEHGRCPVVSDMFANTRTTFTTRLVRYLAWNMPYHVEHHTMPNVPFHQLPALHELIKNHIKITENGYFRFHKRYVSEFASTKMDE